MTHTEAVTFLFFDKKTGFLYCKEDRLPRKRKGDIACIFHKNSGYRRIKFKQKSYFAHRVVWLLHYGEWPKDTLDHINGIKTDNRIENLRDVSKRENSSWTYKHRSGHLIGTSFVKSKNKWSAKIKLGNKKIHLGLFKTAEEANDVYLKTLNQWEKKNGKRK